MKTALSAAAKVGLAFTVALSGGSLSALGAGSSETVVSEITASAQGAPSALPSAAVDGKSAGSAGQAPPSASPGAPALVAASDTKAPGKMARETLDPSEGVDALSDAEALQALQALKANFLDGAAFSDEAVTKATLQGLLDRLGPGAALEQQTATAEPESPFRAEILDDKIGYARLGSLSRDHLREFESALGSFVEKNLAALIIDLRATPASSDYEVTSDYLKRLTPKGKLLFTVHRPSAKQERIFTSNQEPAFRGVVVTLVDANTAGGAEVIASVLRVVNNALVVGQNTAGTAAEFRDIPLHSGKSLRVAVAEVKVSPDISIFPKGLKPDLEVAVSEKETRAVLELGLEKGVSGLVYESERPRLNEAALVAGVNPELDEYEAEQKSGTQGQRKRGLTDAALQRAVDLITTLQIFGKAPSASN